MDQDRDAPLLGEREDGGEPVVAGVEALRPRVELDPPRARVEAAGCLLDRRLVQVEADERHEPALRPRREGQRPVVGGAERRMAVGLVEAEHERPRDPVVGHHPPELVVIADHPVDIGAEMEVRVEHVGARRDHPPELGVVEG